MGFKKWLFSYPLRWNKILAGAGLLTMFTMILGNFSGVDTPPEAFWLTVGIVVGAFASTMTAPDPSKSELLEYVEKEKEADVEFAKIESCVNCVDDKCANGCKLNS